MNTKSRLLQFIDYLGITVAEFERSVGFSNGYIRNISKSIQPSKAEKISSVYPEVNIGWVLSGEGEMLKSDNPAPTVEIQHLQELIRTQTETINSQKLLIVMLQEKIEGLQRAISEKEG